MSNKGVLEQSFCPSVAFAKMLFYVYNIFFKTIGHYLDVIYRGRLKLYRGLLGDPKNKKKGIFWEKTDMVQFFE